MKEKPNLVLVLIALGGVGFLGCSTLLGLGALYFLAPKGPSEPLAQVEHPAPKKEPVATTTEVRPRPEPSVEPEPVVRPKPTPEEEPHVKREPAQEEKKEPEPRPKAEDKKEKPAPRPRADVDIPEGFVEDSDFSVIPTVLRKGVGSKIPYQVRRLLLTKKQAGRRLKLAVSEAQFDDIGKVLTALKIPFDTIAWADNDWSVERLEEYDVVFLNCGGTKAGIKEQDALKKFVERGGTVYASDMQHQNISSIFRRATVNFGGEKQTVRARVVEPNLRAFLGNAEIDLRFDANSWRAAGFGGDKITTYLEGEPFGGSLPRPKTPFPPVPVTIEPNLKPSLPGVLKPPTAKVPTKVVGLLSLADAPEPRDKRPHKRYTVRLKANVPYQVDMVSQVYITRLVLRDKKGAIVASNTNNDDKHSFLFFTPPADDDYFISAVHGRAAPGQFGPFGLQIAENHLRHPGGPGRTFPLLVKFPHQAGQVIFTSFHNQAQVSELERKLLEFLVFSTVTAKAETTVADLMLGLGYDRQLHQTFNLAEGAATPEQTYKHPGGALQIAAGFSSAGAKVRLSVIAPTGEKIEHEDGATFLIEMAAAPAGTYRFRATAAATPFPNFPLFLAVGKGNQ